MSFWDLRITPEQFQEIYGDSMDVELFQRQPETEEEYLTDFLPSKLWRLNNLYTIVDKHGERIPFRMNYAQHKVYAQNLVHPRLIILKSRQQGISTFWLISYLDDGLIYDDFNVGLMAQGKSEAGTLLKRTLLAWDTFPPQVCQFLEQALVKSNSEELGFANGSTLFIRTSFRSATLQRLHISEYGKIANKYPERAKETKTGTLQAIAPGNTVVIESTAEGDNDFKLMWQKAEAITAKLQAGLIPKLGGKDFLAVFLSWLDDPDCNSNDPEQPSQTELDYFQKLEAEVGVTLTDTQKNFWIQQYRELGDDIYQEYPATPEEAFTKANDGAYYAVPYHNYVRKKHRVVSDLYDPNLPVHVAMDLGMNDTFTIGFFQVWEDGARLVDEYADSGESLEFYVNRMNETGYTFGTVICPHDIQVKELGTGKSRLARLRELGVRNIKVLPRAPVADGIEQVRKMLKAGFAIDERCTYSQGCLLNYSKEWDDKSNTWKQKPNHDKWSHGADMIRYFAMAGIKFVPDYVKRKRAARSSGVVDGMAV